MNETLKVIIGLLLGIAVIMFAMPPHSVCDSKKDAYTEEITPLGKQFAKLLSKCKEHTEPGGCVQLFELIRKLEDSLAQVGVQCRPALSKDKLTLMWISSSMEIFARAAWGSKAPANRNARYGWLDLAQVGRFCKLKASMIEISGDDAWSGFVNQILGDLPGAADLGRDESWARSLLSDPCKF